MISWPFPAEPVDADDFWGWFGVGSAASPLGVSCEVADDGVLPRLLPVEGDKARVRDVTIGFGARARCAVATSTLAFIHTRGGSSFASPRTRIVSTAGCATIVTGRPL